MLVLAGALLFLPVAWLLVEIVAGVSNSRSPAPLQPTAIRTAVLVPAHNESTTLRATLECLLPQLGLDDVLLVVADNCTDDTAAIAAAAGALVLHRSDTVHRGKSYALAAGLERLLPLGVDVVVIIDADCIVGPDTVRTLAQICHQRQRPVQCLYRMATTPEMSLPQRVRQFAWIVKTALRPCGLDRLHLPCPLLGTGMAFPAAILRTSQLASGHIAEDLKLYIDLCRAGAAPLFCPSVHVTSSFPSTKEGVQTQRRRWEHGHLDLLWREAPTLVVHGLRTISSTVLLTALDLCIPPLALLSMLLACLLTLCALDAMLTGARLPLVVSVLDALLLTAAILTAWRARGREVLSARHLLYVPLYVLRKIPLYWQFLFARESRWIRSKRHGD